MTKKLELTISSLSSSGCKTTNQDAVKICVPNDTVLNAKGAAFAIADGISTSEVSHIASQAATDSFINDYYSTPEAWSTKTSALKVLKATNYWLFAQSQQSDLRFDLNKGYVCTLSAVVIRDNQANIFHCGDSRVYHYSRHHHSSIRQVTQDHQGFTSEGQSYLSRGLGIKEHVEIDSYSVPLSEGDTLLLTTDGVHDYLSASQMTDLINAHQDLDRLTDQVSELALSLGSDDNISVIAIRIKSLPDTNSNSIVLNPHSLKRPPKLTVGQTIDNYQIVKELHITSRSHVYLAQDLDSKRKLVLKTLSEEMRQDEHAQQMMLMENWVAQRLSNPHLMSAYSNPHHSKSHLYSTVEYIAGFTLEQWIKDNPTPSLTSVRAIVLQAAKGLQAMHRQEMVHQDLRPANIMIDEDGVVKIIDFGATRVAGLAEATFYGDQILGTAQYSAPEYFLGETGNAQSDLFSLGVITYQMLTGKLPYGTHVAKATTAKQQSKLLYTPIETYRQDIPNWVEQCIKKALSVEPHKRYTDVYEFSYDLTHPNPKYTRQRSLPILERNPILFWQRCCLILAILLMISLFN